MTKHRFNLRNMVKTVAILVAVTVFSACGKDDNPNDLTGGEVQIEIKKLPISGELGICMLSVYDVKPVQYYGFQESDHTLATGTISAADGLVSPPLISTTSIHGGEYFYSGGEGYIYLYIITGVMKNGHLYQHFIYPDKLPLVGGINRLDFADFEILHEYGGSKGILRIEGVPAEYTKSFSVEIYEYYPIEDIDELGGAPLKPFGEMGDPQYFPYSYYTDCLSIPLSGYTNQEWDNEAGRWYYEPTNRRFDLSGQYLVKIRGFDPDNSLYYVEANFTNGRTTIQWGSVRRME